MRTDSAGSIFTLKYNIEIFLVVGKIRGRSFGSRIAVARNVLPEVGDDKFRFALPAIKKILNLWDSRYTRNPGNGNRRFRRKGVCVLLGERHRSGNAEK